MVTIYTTPSCSSCRKAKKWLDDYGIEYNEINIFKKAITKKDIMSMLKNSESGFDDIVSTRAKYIKENNIDISELKVQELFDLIMEHPSILRRPIILEGKKMQVGYNNDEIRVFIPKEDRELINELTCSSCQKEEDCKCEYVDAISKGFEAEAK